MKTMLLPVVFLGLFATPLVAQDQALQGTLQEQWRQAYRSIAEGIEMSRHGTPLAMRPEALLVYTNPVRETEQHGAIYLWTQQDRPAVFGSIWSSVDRGDPTVRNVCHEWHSLDDAAGMRAVRDGQPLWICEEPGVEWQPLAPSPAVADARVARLVQMRSLARRLSASIESEGESELRLITQPLYRYPPTVEGAVDGAIFVFAMGTDPEVLVLIEAQEEDGQPTWRRAFARFGARPMIVHDDRQAIVWSCNEAVSSERNGKYHLHYRAEQIPNTLAGRR